jgi:predicted nucleic acid-binding protein
MERRKAILDANLFIDYWASGAREDLIEHRPLVRYLSAVVLMELRSGIRSERERRDIDALEARHRNRSRTPAPSQDASRRAGDLLDRLRRAGYEVRAASLVNDLLIALTARELGATVLTRDRDFLTLRRFLDFDLELVE